MDPSSSMNAVSGHVDLKHLEARGKLYAAQRASQPLTFHPNDGSAPLRAWALSEAGDGYWDIIIDNHAVENGTPHRIFETRSRMVGPLDIDMRGLFSIGTPPHVRDARTSHGPSPYQLDNALPNEKAIRNQADFTAYAADRQMKNQRLGAMLGETYGYSKHMATAKDLALRQSFSRVEILTSLRAILASKGGLVEAITAFESLE